ncbi:NACHT domain-containing protein [Chiayiivirga flava]|uniref:NACHT domain-containing protein n=1 Tax=Chiayiivirga flava TaxID=659595 RepID=A0A7W8FXZ8_9GAMM|nr:NACHT domain-containing protein [Chiayiivirga flava]MBB5206857.1 hypothetical protein [Chiayiivirga flava]
MIDTAIVSATLAGSKLAVEWVSGLAKAWRLSNSDKREWNEMCAAIVSHTSNLVGRFSVIRTIAFPNDSVELDSIYVPLTLVNEKLRISCKVNSFPTDLLNKHKKIMVVDAAGMGKSTVTKVIYLKCLSERKHLPLYVDLRRLSGDESVEHSLGKQMGLKQKHYEFFSELLTTKPILIVFDGFDEITDSQKQKVARALRDFSDRAKESRIIITSRPELPFSEYTDFATLSIQRLTIPEASLLIEKYGLAYNFADAAAALLAELNVRHSATINSFLENPLLTSLVFRAFEYKSIVPVKRTVFYRQVFDALYASHDANKETGFSREKKCGLHEDEFHRVLRALASIYKREKSVEVKKEKFLDMVKEVRKSICSDLIFAPQDFLADATHAVPIFVRDGEFVRWSHKSLMDYFLAEFLILDYSASKEDALKKIAFGQESTSNENLLTLTCELDPALFSKAVVVPAIKELTQAHDNISQQLPPHLDKDLRRDISIFCSLYHVYALPDQQNFNPHIWDQLGEKGSKNKGLNLDIFVPQFIYYLGLDAGALLISAHRSFVALRAAISLGLIPTISLWDISRSYSDSEATISLKSLKRRSSIFLKSSDENTWDEQSIDNNFPAVMKTINAADFPVVDFPGIAKYGRELEKASAASIAARSTDIF